MDWRSLSLNTRTLPLLAVVVLLLVIAHAPRAHCWSSTPSMANNAANATPRKEISPYVDILFCPLKTEPWTCARQQAARMLDLWDDELQTQWQRLKVEADRQLNSTIEKRGYSATEMFSKEKPSTILKKIEIGTNFMKEYFAETMDGFLGREYEYMRSTANNAVDDDDDEEEDDEEEDGDDVEDTDNDDNEDTDADTDADTDGDGDGDADEETAQSTLELPVTHTKNSNIALDNASNGDEFIEIEEAQKNGQLKKPGGGGKKKKKKKGQASEAATVLVVQPLQHHEIESDEHGGGGGHGGGGHGGGGHGGGGKPLKKKRKKRKHQKPDHSSGSALAHESSGHLGLGLLEDLIGAEDLLDSGGKRKKKHPTKYGRSNGVTRGKKKKKKKALMKLVLLGSFLKAKIELLLKILGAHLQIKFFAIALIGMLINIARFWIDIKRGAGPQKVVYVEHAHHQHHYEDHGDEWSEQSGGGGGYWKRSLQKDPGPAIDDPSTIEANAGDSYQSPNGAHYMAYRNQWPQQQQQQ